MRKRIAVEEQLTPIKDYLKVKGYEVVQLGPNVEADAVVVSGQNENLMNIQNIEALGPVINAEGMTPEEVYEELQRRPMRVPLEKE